MNDRADDAGYPRKRARTRSRLLEAGTEAIAAVGPNGLTVGDVAERAGVAVGTFYNHFPGLDDLVDEIAEQLGGGVEIAQAALDAIENDPAVRVALGTLQLLEMAETDQQAAYAFVTLVASKPDFRARVRAIVGRTIAEGVDAGRFDVAAGPAATNAVLGTTLQSMRSRVLDESEPAEARAVIELVLRTLGVPRNRLGPIIRQAEQTLHINPVDA